MELIIKIIIGIGAYLMIVCILPFLLFPNFLIIRPIQRTKKLQRLAKKLKTRNKEKTFRNVFNYVQKEYSSEPWKVPSDLYKGFIWRVSDYIDIKQFMPCNVQSAALVALLLNTGQFTKRDFIPKIRVEWFGFIHKYYNVIVGNKIFVADPYYNLDKVIGKIKKKS